MNFISSSELREKFFAFFRSKEHKIEESASLIPKNDPSLLFNSAGMAPFKDMFLGKIKPQNPRVASIQKCVRTTDIENIGITSRHLTFFEMMGNFSFGDYFKQEAIEWAWEFLTRELKLPIEKLYVTIYKNDDESFEIWKKLVPEEKISRLGENSNFWVIGEQGPCGPCSEILFDKGEKFGCGKNTCKPGCDCDRYLEVWNLVFTQFDRQKNGDLKPLPQKNIDTGMGFERLLSVVQNADSVYETDVFTSIFDEMKTILNTENLGDAGVKKAYRIIADHMRSAVFMISDGVFSGNEGRGYVLKRLIRRSIRQGNKLKAYDFLGKIAEKIIENMKNAYPYLVEKKTVCLEIINNEEKKFAETLSIGERMFNEIKVKTLEKQSKIISGVDAFKLFDTYGLPLDLIEELAEEEGFSVDIKAYNDEMLAQKNKSRQNVEGWSGNDAVFAEILSQNPDTEFVGYSQNMVETRILNILKFENGNVNLLVKANCESGEIGIIIEKTPFYAESGGQKSDQGEIVILGLNGEVAAKFEVSHSKKYLNKIFVSFGKIVSGNFETNAKVVAIIDVEKRNKMRRNHTATHLLQAVLRKNLGSSIEQAGSEVTPFGFRFDFAYPRAIEREILDKIELELNELIEANYLVKTREMNLEEAKKTNALAFFDEKYGEKVRVVRISKNLEWDDNLCVSTEFCGGTHVNATSEIALVKLLSEASVASGIRRIEAISGREALKFLNENLEKMRKIQKLVNSTDKAVEQVENLLNQNKNLAKENEILKEKMINLDLQNISQKIEKIGNISLIIEKFENVGMNLLRKISDNLKNKLNSNSIIFLIASEDENYSAICSISKDLRDFDAKNIMKIVTDKFGGGGGGRQDLAQAGFKTDAKSGEITDFIRTKIRNLLKVPRD